MFVLFVGVRGGAVRAAVRVGAAGSVAVLAAVLLGGCGGAGEPGAAAAGSPAAAPGGDGEADPQQVFTEAELEDALLPVRDFGEHAKVLGTDFGLFGRFGGGDWSQCERVAELRREHFHGFQGLPSVTRRVSAAPGAEPGRAVELQLVSLPAERAGRYLEIRRGLNERCPEAVIDLEAGTATEHHAARAVDGVGDEALAESTRHEGDDSDGTVDGGAVHRIDVRVGGVLAIVTADDEDTGLALAARAARQVRSELYGEGGR